MGILFTSCVTGYIIYNRYYKNLANGADDGCMGYQGPPGIGVKNNLPVIEEIHEKPLQIATIDNNIYICTLFTSKNLTLLEFTQNIHNAKILLDFCSGEIVTVVTNIEQNNEFWQSVIAEIKFRYPYLGFLSYAINPKCPLTHYFHEHDSCCGKICYGTIYFDIFIL